ncbi:MAG: 50S ribosomal protein L17 [Rickettsiales bacterium]|nr:50S ribosomal protein L17 [Rickettsiales bacterium]
MNHRIKGRKLSRNSAHRKALMRNLAISLIEYEFIKTTLPKAKELRPYIEKLITLAKVDNLANRRLAISTLGNQEIIEKLFTVVGKNAAKRNGGYTRIMKYGFRTGDKAPMAIIEIVDRKVVVETSKEESDSKKTKRSATKKENKKEAAA